MLLILAGRNDQVARALVERWRSHDARLVTCKDLSTAGWRYSPGEPRASRVVAEGESIPVNEIDALLTRLPCVTDKDLPHIREEDRSYVASEMTAYLTAFLFDATFPVINRPSPTCLMGPGWRQEQWLGAASRVGMRIGEQSRFTPGAAPVISSEDFEPVTVTVVRDRCVGRVDKVLAAQAVRLAAIASVELLAVRFSSPSADALFLDAYLGPDISQDETADALLEDLLARRASSGRN
jgi:hypothetical protein